MSRLYADEQFPKRVVEILRDLGHDVMTVQEAGNTGVSDENVLAFAQQENRAVLTLDRRDFGGLHRVTPQHSGIIICTDDRDKQEMAHRIDRAIVAVESLKNQLIRVYKPS